MIVDPDQEYWIQYKEGWNCQSGSASFGTKVAFLNGVDLSFMNLLLDPTCQAKWLKYLT